MAVNDDIKAMAQSGAVKVDVGSSKQEVVGRISFGDRCYGGELVFVPRRQDPSALKGRPHPLNWSLSAGPITVALR